MCLAGAHHGWAPRPVPGVSQFFSGSFARVSLEAHNSPLWPRWESHHSTHILLQLILRRVLVVRPRSHLPQGCSILRTLASLCNGASALVPPLAVSWKDTAPGSLRLVLRGPRPGWPWAPGLMYWSVEGDRALLCVLEALTHRSHPLLQVTEGTLCDLVFFTIWKSALVPLALVTHSLDPSVPAWGTLQGPRRRLAFSQSPWGQSSWHHSQLSAWVPHHFTHAIFCSHHLGPAVNLSSFFDFY